MVGRDIDPSDIGKHSKMIKAAQKDMTQSDILVCGKCHSVFHFIDLFKEHKDNGCTKESYLKDCRDTKPKLWAFLLWKSSQLNNNNSSNHINSWNLYQQWIRMDESVRETWVVAGKTILSFAKLGQGSLQEMPVKITKTVVDSNKNTGSSQSTPTNKFTSPTRQQNTTEQNKQPPTQIIMRKDDSNDSLSKTIEQQKVVRKTAGTPITIGASNKTSTSTPIFTRNINRRANRTVPNTNGQEIEEQTVEKIIAKRFNPRRKMHEFLVKWEGLPHDQNTWEPQIHLETCPQLLETFEKQLARQKEQRAKQTGTTSTPTPIATTAVVQPQQQNTVNSPVSSPLSPNKMITRTTPTTTVTRIVKSGTTEQIKKSFADEDIMSSSNISNNSGIKRKHEEIEFDNEEFDVDDIPIHTVKKIKNGAAITVTTDTKVDTKVIPQQQSKQTITRAINGTTKISPTSSDITSSSADIIINKDSSQNSGVFKTTGSVTTNVMSKTEAHIRVLSKGENTASGVVRINSNTSLQSDSTTSTGIQRTTTTGGGTIVTATLQTSNTPTGGRVTQKIGGTSTPSTNSAQISQVQTHRIVMTPKEAQITKTPATVQTRVISKTSPVSTGGSTVLYHQNQSKPNTTTIQRTSLSPQRNPSQSPTSGKMIINRNVKSTPTSRNVSPAITPEQKIIQLSKSGDLKVTRKVVTQPVSQTGSQFQQQQQQQQSQRQQLLQQQHQQQQHLTRAASISKSESEHSQSPIPSESLNDSQSSPGQFTLCEITGKVIGPGGEKIPEPEIQEEKQELQQQQQTDEILNVQMSSDSQTNEGVEAAFAAGDLALATEDGTHQFLANEDGTPLLVTGEDGTIYQVAGKNAEGQTILIAQGADGEQLAYVAAAEDGEEGVLALDNAMAEAVAQMLPEQQAEAIAAAAADGKTQFIIKQSDDGTGDGVTAGGAIGQPTDDVTQGLTIQTGDGGDSQDGNIPAEVVQADLPSPGGTRRVVLLLQDGTFMMTEMHDDEYQALNLVS